MKRRRRLLLPAILLGRDGAGVIAVRARPSWALPPSSPLSLHRRRPSSTSTLASTPVPRDGGDYRSTCLGYMRSECVSILDSLRVRGGGDEEGAEADGGSKGSPGRRRRRRKKKTPTDESSSEIPAADTPAAVGGGGPGVMDDGGSKSSKTKVKKRRKELSKMFSGGNVDSNEQKYVDGDSREMVEDSGFPLDGVEGSAEASATDEKGSGPPSSAKKKRRRKRRVAGKGDDPRYSHVGERAEKDASADALPKEMQEEPEETPAARVRRKRRKRRAAAAGRIVGDDEACVVKTLRDKGLELDVVQIDSQPDEEIVPENIDVTVGIEDNLSIEPMENSSGESADAGSLLQGAGSPPGTNKKRRRRRKCKEADEASTDREAGEQVVASGFQPRAASVAIDSSVDIPSEEGFPESISASARMEEKDMPIMPSREDGTGSPALMFPVVHGGEESEADGNDTQTPIESKKKRRRRHKRRKAGVTSSDWTSVISTDAMDEEGTAKSSALSFPNAEGGEASGADEDDTRSSSKVKRRRRRRCKRNEATATFSDMISMETEEKARPVDAPEGDGITGSSASMVPAADDGDEQKAGGGNLRASGEAKKKKRRRRKRGAADATWLNIEPGETVAPDRESSSAGSPPSESEPSLSIAVETLIEVPRDEVAPENIETSLDVVGNAVPIDPVEGDLAEIMIPFAEDKESEAQYKIHQEEVDEDKSDEAQGEEEERVDEEIDGEGEEGEITEEEEDEILDEEEEEDGIEKEERNEETDDDGEGEEGEEIDEEEEGEKELEEEEEETEEEKEDEKIGEENEAEEEEEKDKEGEKEDIDEDDEGEREESEGDSTDNSLASISIEEDIVGGDAVAEDDAAEAPESAESDTIVVSLPSVQEEIIAKEEIDQTCAAKNHSEGTTKEEREQTSDGQGTGKLDKDSLTLSMVTWNLAETAPSEKEASFLRRFRKNTDGEGSDLVLIGVQECEDIKPRRTEGRRSRHIRRMGIMMLGKEYVPLVIHSLGGLQCALYCHRDVLGDVEMIDIADVTCGVGNVFHNKGAIGVYLKMKRRGFYETDPMKSSRMLFVTGHLAAHIKNVDARNSDFKRIVSELEVQAPARFLRPRRNRDGSPAECDGSYLLRSMDHVFFGGDLNYRIEHPREYVEKCIIDIQQCSNNSGVVTTLMNKLLRRDQLLQSISSGQGFVDFNEGQITFLPTFKFDKGTIDYDTSHKQRVPAWTDRILVKSDRVQVLEYQSVPKAKHSDHRPVFGTYRLGWGLVEKTKLKGFARKPKRSRSRSRQKKK